MVEEEYSDTEGSPSQVALDQQLRQSQLIEQAGYLGRIGLARTQISEAVQEGADAVKGRELLGRLDDMIEFPTAGDDSSEVYKEFKTFIKGGTAPVAAPSQPPSPPRARKPNINQARRDYHEGKTDVYPG